jgi:hypothetical protein
MTEITARQINKDWKDKFPKLKKIGSNQIFEIIGPLLVGIELVKSKFGKEYEPHIMICSLFGSDVSNCRVGNDLKSCLDSPEIYFGLSNSKGGQFKIDYRNHKELLDNAIIEMQRQHLPLEKDISINDLFKFFDKKTSQCKSSGELAQYLEFQYLVALFLDNESSKNDIIREIERQKPLWNMEHFELWLGSYDKWFDNLKNKKPNDVVKSFNNVLKNDKLEKLTIFKLI